MPPSVDGNEGAVRQDGGIWDERASGKTANSDGRQA